MDDGQRKMFHFHMLLICFDKELQGIIILTFLYSIVSNVLIGMIINWTFLNREQLTPHFVSFQKEYYFCLSDTELSLQEHKNCGEMTEIEAKVKYVKLARSLRTYGVSFFLVKVMQILLTTLYGWLCIIIGFPLIKGQRCF